MSHELAQMLSSACLAAKHSFRNVLAIPGGRVFFLASDGPLYPDIATRIEQRHIKTKLVNRHYLDGMLTPDRMADLASATAQPAAMNRDFSPVLYYYHLRHWMSQFNVQFGVIQVGLLVVLGLLPRPAAGQRICPVRFGLCGVRPGGGFAAGLSGPVRLGLSPGGCHRNGLHGRPGAGGTHGEPAPGSRWFRLGQFSSFSDCGVLGAEGKGPFPLTPALSLGERENSGQSSGEPVATDTGERRRAAPPLPKGEGRGEGEGDAGNRVKHDSAINLRAFGLARCLCSRSLLPATPWFCRWCCRC